MNDGWRFFTHISGDLIASSHQLCQTAVGIMGDVCRALGVGIVPYCNQIMTLLLQNLQVGVLREVTAFMQIQYHLMQIFSLHHIAQIRVTLCTGM